MVEIKICFQSRDLTTMRIVCQKKVTMNRTQISTKILKSLGIIMHSGYEPGLLSENALVQTFTNDVFKASYLISLRHNFCIYKIA